MLSNDVIKFAKDNTGFYEAVAQYYSKKDRTMDDEKALNVAFFSELEAQSGVSRSVNGFAANPSVRWSFMSIVDAALATITPIAVSPSLNMFMEMQEVGAGDIVKFTVEPNSFYTVSMSGRGERESFRTRDHATEIALAPRAHQITIYENYYSVLAGKASFARMIVKAADSLVNAMYKDALGALNAGLAKIAGEPYRFEGAFEAKKLLTMCETVSVYNGGAKPIIAGTRVALMNVLPDSAAGYRMNVDGNGGAVQVIRDFYGFDAVALNQAAAGKDKLALADDKLYIICPTQDKLVKGVVSREMSNTNDFFENADLTKNITLNRDWNFEYISGAKAGVYTISG